MKFEKYYVIAVALSIAQGIYASQHMINCPTGRFSNCYTLPETGKCCFGHAAEPEVHVNDVALLLYDNGLQQFSANTRIEHCVFMIVHDYVSQASANWINDLAHSIQNIGKCIVQSKIHAQAGKSQQNDAMRRESVLYNPAMPYRKVSPTIIIVDWAGPAMTLYQTAAGAAKQIGRILAEKLSMNRQFVSKRPNIHCIGEGLGAHICGIAGSNYALGEFMRVTGLDPSRPLFEPSEDDFDVPFDDRLDSSDARFVDVIHTTVDLGFRMPMGHLDFYVNGAKGSKNVSAPQSGCAERFYGDNDRVCSHRRAREVFLSSFQRQCLVRVCGSNSLLERDLCHMGWSAYRCKGHGDYCGQVDMDSSNVARCHYDIADDNKQTTKLATQTIPSTTRKPEWPVREEVPKKQVPVNVPAPPTGPPAMEPVDENRRGSYNSLPQHLAYKINPQTYYPMTRKPLTKATPPTTTTTTTEEPTTQPPSPTTTTKFFKQENIDHHNLPFEPKQPVALSLFTDVGGNCAGNTMIVLPQRTMEECAKTCLDTMGCVGFSVERDSAGPIFTCIIKSLACKTPNPAGDFKFFRREL